MVAQEKKYSAANTRPLISKKTKLFLSAFLLAILAAVTTSPINAEPDAPAPSATSSAYPSELAQYYLYDLAYRKEFSRHVGGGITIAAGLFMTGVSLAGTDGINQTYLTTLGLVTMGAGAAILIFPTEVEVKADRIYRIENPEDRERAAARALKNIADQARITRFIGSATSIGLALLLSQAPYFKDGVLWPSYIGIAALGLILPTEEEMAYQNYLEASRQNISSSFKWDISPNLGLTASYRFNF